MSQSTNSNLLDQVTAKVSELTTAASNSISNATTTDKSDKKSAKADKKAAKELAKQQREAELLAAQQRTAPTVHNHTDLQNEQLFGDLPLIQSRMHCQVDYIELEQLHTHTNNNVWLRARVNNIRAKGKLAFIVLRSGFTTVQCVIAGAENDTMREMVRFASKISAESIIDIYGTVTQPVQPLVGVTQSNIEIQVKRVYVVMLSVAQLPFQLTDASRSEPTETEKQQNENIITVGTDVRLDNRWIDLRTAANHAIFIIQSRVAQYFRQFLLDRNFIEIHTPKIIPGASEGGAAVFSLKYFNNDVCLAQSPQLHKQMAVMSDFRRVFEIGPVFRAEDSNTHRHTCEFTGLDFEMEIKAHYNELTQVLGNLFVYIFDQINANCQAELSAINAQYPFTPLKYNKDTLVIPFSEGIQLLRDAGETVADLEDISTPHEKLIGKLVKQKYNTDFYIIDRYPEAARPFYTMLDPNDARYTNSYDVFVRGEEITSGAQRIHDTKILAERATAKGIPLSNIATYLESFKYGAWPHGGAGVGLERVVMLFLGLDNIRKTSMFPRTPNRMAP